MKKHTNFNQEITTNYRPTNWTDRLLIATGVLLVIALPFIIADLIWGAEVVTEWVAQLIK
jgi:preprotein translocase subunit SecE